MRIQRPIPILREYPQSKIRVDKVFFLNERCTSYGNYLNNFKRLPFFQGPCSDST